MSVGNGVADAALYFEIEGHPVRGFGCHHLKHLIVCAIVIGSIAPDPACSAPASLAQGSKTAEARRLLVARDVPGAMAAMEAAVEQEADAHGADAPEVAVALTRLGLLAMARLAPDYDGAKSAYERALRIREKRFGSHAPSVALVLEDLARVHLAEATDSPSAERHQQIAQRLIQRALEIRARRGLNRPAVADALYNVAASSSTPFAEKVVSLYRRALSVREKAFGPNSIQVAESLIALADKLQGHQRWRPNPSIDPQGVLTWCRRARPVRLLRERALKIQESALGADAPELTKVLEDLADSACPEIGEKTDPIALHRRILAIDEKASGHNSLPVLYDLNHLASRLSALEYAAEKRAIELRANRIKEMHIGMDPREAPSSYESELPGKLIAKFDEEEKIDRVERVNDFLLDQASAAHDLPTGRRAFLCLPIAKTYEELGDLVSADRLLRACGTISQRASFLAAHGRFAEAAPEFERALQAFQTRRASDPSKNLESDRYAHYQMVDGYVAVLTQQSDGKQAEKQLLEALDLEQHAKDANVGFLIERLDALGDFYALERKAAEAEKYYQKALNLAESERRGPLAGNELVLRQFDKLIALYVAEARVQDADALFKKSLLVEQPDYENFKIGEASPTVDPAGLRSFGAIRNIQAQPWGCGGSRCPPSTRAVHLGGLSPTGYEGRRNHSRARIDARLVQSQTL